MKRLHVHVSVKDLDSSIRFYSQLFAAQPTVQKPQADTRCCAPNCCAPRPA
jgi:predicted enzyme related to lactoylglutathione lyase